MRHVRTIPAAAAQTPTIRNTIPGPTMVKSSGSSAWSSLSLYSAKLFHTACAEPCNEP